MAANKGGGVTIIKKIKKGGHVAHGGAWKVAYADFVTAMMAFFLLLWLLNSVTQEQLEGISNYFAPAAVSQTTSGAGGILGGQTMTEEGTEVSQRSKPTVSLSLPPPRLGTGGEGTAGEDTADPQPDVSEEQAEDLAKRMEERQFEEAMEQLQQAIENVPAMSQLAKSLLVDNTVEGLRIQIVDQEGLAMFPRGSAQMFDHTKKVLELVAKVIDTMPQKIAIAGHTDGTPFASATGYSNWELSSDRANAARRALLELGVPEDRLSRIMGKAATEPLVIEDPNHPRNRRLSITLLRKSVEHYDEPTAVKTPAEIAREVFQN